MRPPRVLKKTHIALFLRPGGFYFKKNKKECTCIKKIINTASDEAIEKQLKLLTVKKYFHRKTGDKKKSDTNSIKLY